MRKSLGSTQGRVTIRAPLQQPDGDVADVELPPRSVVLGELTGDAPTGFATSEPARLTRENADRLANLDVRLTMELENQLIAGEENAPKLRANYKFDAHPDRWPAAIVAQTPPLRVLDGLERLIGELNAALSPDAKALTVAELGQAKNFEEDLERALLMASLALNTTEN